MSGELGLADIGLPEEATSDLAADQVARIGAVLNVDHVPAKDQPLPLLWHWGFFTPVVPTTALGADGHPVLAAGPLTPYPRRMWASGTVEAPGYLVVGVAAVRSTRLLDSKKVQGRSGELCLVQLEHRYQQFGEEQLVEEQTLVYRKAGAAIPLPVGDLRPEVSRAQWREDHTLDSPTLFRFSAVTFNSHRIHYDQPYATSIEGYPALVVHGPLTALLVAEAIRTKAGRPLDRFEFRASAPLFVDLPFAIVGTSGEAPEAHVVRNDGLEAMHVMARLMPR